MPQNVVTMQRSLYVKYRTTHDQAEYGHIVAAGRPAEIHSFLYTPRGPAEKGHE